MSRSTHLTALGVFLVLNGLLSAQPLQPVELGDCLETAWRNNPQLKALSASLAQKRTGRKGLEELPIDGRLVRRDLPIRKRQSELAIPIVEARIRHVHNRIGYAVTRLFYTVVYANAQELLLLENLRELNLAREKVRRAIAKGDRPEWTDFTVDAISLAIRRVELQQVRIEEGRHRALAALKEATGVPLSAELFVAHNRILPPTHLPDRTRILETTTAQHPGILQAGLAAKVFHLEAQAQDRLPFARQAPTFAFGADIHTAPDRNEQIDGDYRPGGILVEMPPTLVGSRRTRTRSARQLAERADQVARNARDLVALDAEDAYRKLEGAMRRLDIQRRTEATAKKMLDKMADDIRTLPLKFVIEQFLADSILVDRARAEYNQTLFEAIVALADLNQAIGGGLIRDPAAFALVVVPTPPKPEKLLAPEPKN